jgi:hypothetical protein
MIKLIATVGIATLMTGCVVAPDAGYGYGYGQTYYPDSGYAYGPAYGPAYGTINIWGGGGRDWDRGRDFRRGDHDRGDRGNGRWNDWNRGGHGHGDHGDRD